MTREVPTMSVDPDNPLFEAMHHARDGRACLSSVNNQPPIDFGVTADPATVAQQLRDKANALRGVATYYDHAARAAEAAIPTMKGKPHA